MCWKCLKLLISQLKSSVFRLGCVQCILKCVTDERVHAKFKVSTIIISRYYLDKNKKKTKNLT